MTMFLKRWIRKRKGAKLSIRTKLTLSLLSVAAILLISSCITFLQYRSMSNYVSTLIADNLRNVNLLERLGDDIHSYNAQVMSVLWDEARAEAPALDARRDRAYIDSLRVSSSRAATRSRADSLIVSFDAFARKSRQLPAVIASPLNTRDWYHAEMKPLYDKFREDNFELMSLIYEDLEANSATFDRGFYRSVIPGAVAIAVGLLLVLLLLLFASMYYITPLYKMLRNLDDYRLRGKKYTYTFDGDDELVRLNEGITEVTGENGQLRKRVSYLKESIGRLTAETGDQQ